MIFVSNFIRALAYVIDVVLRIYFWIVIIRVIASWLNADPYNPIVRFLYRATEPVLRPIRKVLPPIGGLDFSPAVVILVIYFLQIWLVPSLIQFSYSLR